MSYVSLIERWGIEEGMNQGLKQGQEQGARETLQKQLKLKFGTAAAEPWLVRLEQASLEQLELWTERILFVDHIDALFAD